MSVCTYANSINVHERVYEPGQNYDRQLLFVYLGVHRMLVPMCNDISISIENTENCLHGSFILQEVINIPGKEFSFYIIVVRDTNVKFLFSFF